MNGSCLVEKEGSAYLRVEDLRLVLLEDSGKTFSWKKRAVEGENSERPVVFWRPSKEKVRG